MCGPEGFIYDTILYSKQVMAEMGGGWDREPDDRGYVEPEPLVVDIATDPNGEVLEAATGSPSGIFVVVKVDGKLKVARGSVYSFYQFPRPIGDRLTDERRRRMIGVQAGDDGHYERDESVRQPAWTESYRYWY